jgi:hypothetical protein
LATRLLLLSIPSKNFTAENTESAENKTQGAFFFRFLSLTHFLCVLCGEIVFGLRRAYLGHPRRGLLVALDEIRART